MLYQKQGLMSYSIEVYNFNVPLLQRNIYLFKVMCLFTSRNGVFQNYVWTLANAMHTENNFLSATIRT